MQKKTILFGILAITIALTGFLVAPRYLAPSNAVSTTNPSTSTSTTNTTNNVSCLTGTLSDFTLTLPTQTISIPVGQSGTFTVPVSNVNPNNCSVPDISSILSISPSTGLTCNSVNNILGSTLSGSSASVPLTITCSATSPGDYIVKLTSTQVLGALTGTAASHFLNIPVHVPSTTTNQGTIGLTNGLRSLTCTAGTTKTFEVVLSNLPSTVTNNLPLSTSISPNNNGLTITGVPNTIGPNSAPASITINCAKAGSYTLTVTAAGATANLTLNIPVTVTIPSVTITPPNVTSLTCTAGQTITSTLNIVVNKGIATLSAANLPTGITATVSPSTLKASGPVTVTINCATAGTFTLNIRAATNYDTISTTLTVNVTNPT